LLKSAVDLASLKTRVPAFHANLLTRFDNENFTNPHPDNLFFLQDDDGDPCNVLDAAIPLDAKYGDMLQPPKLDVDHTESMPITLNCCRSY
jgi:hypothetical protein